jgi:hypothetical protein
LPSLAKIVVSAAVKVARVGNVVRVRKETDHVVESAGKVSVVRVVLAVLAHRVIVRLVHRVSVAHVRPVRKVSRASAHRVHRVSVHPAHRVHRASRASVLSVHRASAHRASHVLSSQLPVRHQHSRRRHLIIPELLRASKHTGRGCCSPPRES